MQVRQSTMTRTMLNDLFVKKTGTLADPEKYAIFNQQWQDIWIQEKQKINRAV
jgi:hypothetical protein